MPDQHSLALHETLELHELLAFKNVCLTKSSTMQILVSDGALKELMEMSASLDRRHITELQSLMSTGVSADESNP